MRNIFHIHSNMANGLPSTVSRPSEIETEVGSRLSEAGTESPIMSGLEIVEYHLTVLNDKKPRHPSQVVQIALCRVELGRLMRMYREGTISERQMVWRSMDATASLAAIFEQHDQEVLLEAERRSYESEEEEDEFENELVEEAYIAPNRPPAWAEFLISFFTPREKRNELLALLETDYYEMVERFGPAKARILYWKEVGRSLWPVAAAGMRWLVRYKILRAVVDVAKRPIGESLENVLHSLAGRVSR